MKGKKADKGQKAAKQGTQLKDVIPPTIKQLPREGKPVKAPEPGEKKILINEYFSQPVPDEWPGDEVATALDFGVDNPNAPVFNDPTKLQFPPSFSTDSTMMIFPRRIKDIFKTESKVQNFLSGYDDQADDKSLSVRSAVRRSTTTTLDRGEKPRSASTFWLEDHDITTTEKTDFTISIFTIYDREETKEEMEKRLKEQAEKQDPKKKKASKVKEEHIDVGPRQVKDVKLSNVDFNNKLPEYSRWIASQLQIIKDRNIRDAYTDKPLWKKIFPQKDGVPVYNPAGKYWVKLYYMGKERKIEIDDKVPITSRGRLLYPRSSNRNEIWTLILTKALIKLTSSKWASPTASSEMEVGDGSIMYALTGYIPETINLKKDFYTKWKSVTEFLNDMTYLNLNSFVTCFSLPDHKPSAPSNRVTNPKDLIDRNISPARKKDNSERFEEEEMKITSSRTDKSPTTMLQRRSDHSGTAIAFKNPTLLDTNVSVNLFKERPTQIIPGFAYSVVESFENETFNMVYVLKRSETEMKLLGDYFQLAKIQISKLPTYDEKVKHRQLKTEIKKKIQDERQKRMEMISKPAQQYKLIRVKSSIGRVPQLTIYSPFTHEDIQLAKKCIVNRLSKPPNYDQYDIKFNDNKSVVSEAPSGFDASSLKPLDDFSRLENAKETLNRGKSGAWFTDKDFLGCFEYAQVYHNPNRFKHKIQTFFQSSEERAFTNYENYEVLVAENIEENEQGVMPNNFLLLLGFSYNKAKNGPILPRPFCKLQKFDFKNFEVIHSYKSLLENIEAEAMTVENKNHVFRLQVTSPLGFNLWLSSDARVIPMTLSDYLTKYEAFRSKILPVDHTAVEKEKYHVFFRGSIKEMDTKDSIICKLKAQNDFVFPQYLRFKLIEVQGKGVFNQSDPMSGIHHNTRETSSTLIEATRFTLEARKRYIILLEGKIPYTITEGSFELEFLYRNSDFVIDPIEGIEPVEYIDKYIPIKYGIIFRERIFIATETQASFYLRLSNITGNIPAAVPVKGKKGPEPIAQLEESELPESRLIRFELLENDKVVSYTLGYNNALLSNVSLYPTLGDDTRNYYLQATFDLREWPEAKDVSEAVKYIHWILKVFATDTLAILKDTQKEDKEKAIKKSWEDKEPGRAEKAKKTRTKYFAFEKKERGENLTEAEIELINEQRQRKPKEEEVKGKDSKKPPPKTVVDTKKAGKGGKKEEVVEEKKPERVLPKSENHITKEIKYFLEHMELPRYMEEPNDGDPDVRSDENKTELREITLLGKEEIYGLHARNVENRDKIKEHLTKAKTDLIQSLTADRTEFKSKLKGIYQQRDEHRKKVQAKKEKEKLLIEIVNKERPTVDEIDKLLQDIIDQDIHPQLIELLKKVRKNAVILLRVDNLNNALAAFDQPLCAKTLEEVKTMNLEIDYELVQKAEEFLEECERNPNFVQEKLAELKKLGKGKKK